MTVFGLKQHHWKIVIDLAIDPLKKLGASVFVFGSRARGTHQEFSDLDLLYESNSKIPLSEIYKIKSNLEQSNLPIKVDLVAAEDCAQSYRNQIHTEKKEV